MRLTSKVWILLAALAVGCATTSPTEPTPHKKFGSVNTTRGCMAPLNTITGASATITVFDTSTDAGDRGLVSSGAERLVVSMFFDQAVTVNYQVKARGSSTWRTVNGSGAGDAITASTFTAIDFRIIGYDNRIQVVTVTSPTTSEMDICPTYDTAASL